ncbi:4'-phosphopantetheinyl transferase [Klebsiella pneumoniae]|nr:4'-phosphopantetheinyl transferase [Klebsiella pneumoniae]
MGRKRQAEHLAGRIAAAYALREVGEKRLPAIGDQRQPLWPTPWFGSISHCGQRALAVIADRPVGVDIERRFTPQLAAELESSIIGPAEKTALLRSGLPYPLALTLAFSAKESGFKATPAANQRALGFADFQIVEITASTLALMFAEQRYLLHWDSVGGAGHYTLRIAAVNARASRNGRSGHQSLFCTRATMAAASNPWY